LASMNVLLVSVSDIGFRTVGGNAAKQRILDKVCGYASATACELVVLPAGFFFAGSFQGVSSLGAHFGAAAASNNVAVVGGVDALAGSKRDGGKVKSGTRKLPFYAFAFDSSGNQLGRWRQQSSRSGNASASNVIDVPARTRSYGPGAAGSKAICVLLCGEIFSVFNRQALVDAVTNTPLDAVIDLGHRGMGQGLIPAMLGVQASAQSAVLHCQHLAGMGRIHSIDRQGQRRSTPVIGAMLPGWQPPPWAAVDIVRI
jgi:hypothetical protein